MGSAANTGTAVMLIATASVVPDEVLADLRQSPGIISVVQLAG